MNMNVEKLFISTHELDASSTQSKYKCTKNTTESFIARNLSKFDNFDVLMTAKLSDKFINDYFWYFEGNFDILLRKYSLSESTIVNNLAKIEYFGLLEDVLITQQLSESLIAKSFCKKKFAESIVKYQLSPSARLLRYLAPYISESILFERVDNLQLLSSNSINSPNEKEIKIKCNNAIKNTVCAFPAYEKEIMSIIIQDLPITLVFLL